MWSFLKVFSEMADSNPISSKKQHEEFSECQDGVTAVVEYGDFACSNTDDLRCLQCAMKFSDYNAYVSHTKKDEHALMGIITGVAKAEQYKMPREFPELYYCALCDIFCFTYKNHMIHLMCEMHTELVNYMGKFFVWAQKIVVGMRYGNKKSKSFDDFENLKHSPYNECELCKMQSKNAKTFKNHTEERMHKSLIVGVRSCNICNLSYVRFDSKVGHLNSPLHAKLKSLMDKMSIPENEITKTPNKKTHISQNMEVNKQYFCKLCNITFDSVVSFRKHRNISIHRNMQQLVQLMSSVRNGVYHCGGTYEESFPYIHYCDLCNVFFQISSPEMYENHLKNRIHLDHRRRAEALKESVSSRKSLPPDPKHKQ